MHITRTTLRDIPALVKLATETFTHSFGHLYSPQQLTAHLEKTCSEAYFTSILMHTPILLAKDTQGIALGYVKFGTLGLPVETPCEKDRELHRLYVHPKHQKKAIGSALMEAALAHTELNQATHIYLGVWEQNLIAQRFYHSYGFRIVGSYDYFVEEHADHELIMVRINPLGISNTYP